MGTSGEFSPDHFGTFYHPYLRVLPGLSLLTTAKDAPNHYFQEKFGVEKWKQPKILHIPVMHMDSELWSFVHGDIDR